MDTYLLFRFIFAALVLWVVFKQSKRLYIYHNIFTYGKQVYGKRVWNEKKWNMLTLRIGSQYFIEAEYQGQILRLYPLATYRETLGDEVMDALSISNYQHYYYNSDYPDYCCPIDENIKNGSFISSSLFIIALFFCGFAYIWGM